jgi:hypothetical protein
MACAQARPTAKHKRRYASRARCEAASTLTDLLNVSAPQITTARDLVESAIKPGSSTLRVLGLVAPLLKTLGPGASPKSLPVAAALVWAFYFGRRPAQQPPSLTS